MRHLSYAVPKVASQAFARKYIMLGRLVTQWAEIVGPDLAHRAQPVATRYFKKGKDGKPEISLDIAVTSADAATLLYEKNIILEKINLIFGDNWVTAIRFVPLSDNQSSPKPRKTSKPLTPAEKTYLSDVLENVADSELQARLRALGQAILQDAGS